MISILYAYGLKCNVILRLFFNTLRNMLSINKQVPILAWSLEVPGWYRSRCHFSGHTGIQTIFCRKGLLRRLLQLLAHRINKDPMSLQLMDLELCDFKS